VKNPIPRFGMCLAFVGVQVCVAAVVQAPTPIFWIAARNGDVTIQPSGYTGEDGWTSAEVNRPIVTGDRLAIVGNGQAEIRSDKGSIVISSDSTVLFVRLDEQATILKFDQGGLDVNLQQMGTSTFEVATHDLSLDLAANGAYHMTTGTDGSINHVGVQSGELHATFRNGKVFSLDPGQQADLAGSEVALRSPVPSWGSTQPTPTPAPAIAVTPPAPDPQAPQPTSPAPVSGGYRRFSGSDPSGSYSAGDYSNVPGINTLQNYGNWDQSPYGTAWYPQVASDWSPYTDGHWSFIGGGWTWIDAAPWGFAPFHYGGWARTYRGWCWVPGAPIYSPARVMWAGGVGGFGVGWFPLGPGEGFATRSYLNRSYLTLVSQQAFVNAARVGSARLPVPSRFAETAHFSNSIAISPTRASVLGTGRTAARPASYVLNRTAYSRIPSSGPVPRSQTAVSGFRSSSYSTRGYQAPQQTTSQFRYQAAHPYQSTAQQQGGWQRYQPQQQQYRPQPQQQYRPAPQYQPAQQYRPAQQLYQARPQPAPRYQAPQVRPLRSAPAPAPRASAPPARSGSRR
jgi:hypothetical protein